MSNPYAIALKTLVSLTETKNLVLAKLTGYDISYISKWSSGRKLPAAKHSARINDQLARYFASMLQSQGQDQAFYRLVPTASRTASLSDAVASYLQSAYAGSVADPSASSLSTGEARLIMGHHDAVSFLTTVFTEQLGAIQDEGNLLILGEFCALTDVGFWKYVETAPLQAKRFTIRVGLDVDRLLSQPRYTSRLYLLLNHLLNCDFMFYEYRHLAHADLIILEDHLALQYSLASPDTFGLCTCLCAPSVVTDIYQRFLLRFTSHEPIFAPSRGLGTDSLGFRTAFYSRSNFFFFLTNGFDFLLPSSAIDDFLAAIQAPPQVVHQIAHLRLMWEELLSTVNVEFLMPTTSLIRYIETGHMFFTDAEFHMSGPARKEHLANIIATMKRNPRIKMGVFQPTSQTTEYHESNLSFYSNFSTAFFKKNPQFIPNDASPIYVISNTKLVNAFHLFFYTLKEVSTYHQYTYAEINEKYQQYKTFIERAIDLHSSLTPPVDNS